MKRALSRKNMWEATPIPVKAALGTVLGVVPQSLLLGGRFRRTLRFVNEAQWWPPERSRAYQVSQIKRICRIAFERSPFHRRRFEEAGLHPDRIESPDDLAVLPTMDKDTLREHLDELVTISVHARNVDYVSTGGTSGIPLHFYAGADRSAIEYAYLVAGWQRAGYSVGTTIAHFRGQLVPEDRNGLRHQYDPLLRRHAYSIFHLTDEIAQRYIEHIATIGPCFLLIYPSAITLLAHFMRTHDYASPSNIRGLLLGSENVYPQQRAMIEGVFGVKAFSWYGHTEKLVLAAECERMLDYHVWPTYGYFELLDARGNPVTTPGEKGEIVGTGFLNTITPFIRYRTGDEATYVGERCEACGRAMPIIRDVCGHRTQEMLMCGDGTLVSWTGLNMHGDTFESVRQFQFTQGVPGEATLRIIPETGFDDRDRKRILDHLDRKLEGRVKLTIELTESISLSTGGKAVYVDQKIVPWRWQDLAR